MSRETYTFVLLGGAATGKTCLCSCFTRNLFVEEHLPTIDDEHRKTITYTNEVDLIIADLGGWNTNALDQEWLRRIKTAHGVVLVYSVTDRRSFEMLESIKEKVDQIKDVNPADAHNTLVPIIVVGTKADLAQERAVGNDELRKWAEEHGIHYYTEVGLANDVYGAKEIFIRLIADIRAQEQAKIDAKAAAEAERKKGVRSPRALLSPRKRDAPASRAAENTEKEETKAKEKQMKQEQKEKEKELKKQLKEQKIKEKEEKERQKREQKEKQKADKMEQKESKETSSQVLVPVPSTDETQGDEVNASQMPIFASATSEEQSPDTSPSDPTQQHPDKPEANGLTDQQKQEESAKEKRKRRETIAALLSPRRFSTVGASQGHRLKGKEEEGSFITRSRGGAVSEDIRVLAETGNLSPRGENTGDAKKKRTRLSIARFRRSEMYSKTPVVQDQEGIPQVQFLRVTKPLDALAEYKISPVPEGAHADPAATNSAPSTPVSHPYMAPHIAPSPSPAEDRKVTRPVSTARVRPVSMRNLPKKPLPSTPPAPARKPLPAWEQKPLPSVPPPSASSAAAPSSVWTPAQQHTPAVQSQPLPSSTQGSGKAVASLSPELDFPNLDDLPIFRDLLPPPTNMGPPPPPPPGGASAVEGK